MWFGTEISEMWRGRYQGRRACTSLMERRNLVAEKKTFSAKKLLADIRDGLYHDNTIYWHRVSGWGFNHEGRI